MKLPVPRWQLLQVGFAKAPRHNATTELSYGVVESVVQMHSGVNYDFYRNQRAPFSGGAFRHTGLYKTEFISQANVWPVSEMDLIQGQKGLYAPILFAKDYTASTPTQDCCFITPSCWLFAWAYGKVRTVTNNFNVEDYASPDVAEVAIEGVLETPLRAVTYSRWRYGHDLIPDADQKKLLPVELELAQAESKSQWWIPCEIPSPKTDNRFWPRDLYLPYHADPVGWFDWEHWDCAEVILLRSPSERLFRIWGNSVPSLNVLARGDTKFELSNSLGTATYEYALSNEHWVYMDSSSNLALNRAPDMSVRPYVGNCNIPHFEYYENRVRVISGELIIGTTPRWIN